MMTRKELIKKYPGYKNLSAIEKILLENNNTNLGKARKIFQATTSVVFAVASPVSLYFLTKEGNIEPNPDVLRYSISGVVGLVSGYAVGLAIGTLAYETIDKEGIINKQYNKIKNYFIKK